MKETMVPNISTTSHPHELNNPRGLPRAPKDQPLPAYDRSPQVNRAIAQSKMPGTKEPGMRHDDPPEGVGGGDVRPGGVKTR